MAERYPGDGAAENGFGRRTLQAWEARLLYKAGYMAPPDTRNPPGWKLSADGIPIPPAPMPVELSYEIQEYITAMDDPFAAESPDNLLYWEEFFAERRAQELARHEGPPNESPPKRNNSAGRRRWWSASGRTLRAVLEHINEGNTPCLGFPQTPTPASRSGRRPPVNWMPRRMTSMSSSSSALASHSGSASLRTPTAPSGCAQSSARRARLCARRHGHASAALSSASHGRRRRQPATSEDSVPPQDGAFRMALEQSLRDSAPPPPMEPSSTDIVE